MSQSPAAIERAREDLAAQRPWKARERLRAYLKAFPLDPVARDLLGQTLYDMRDLPAAGAIWFLSERDDDSTRAAIDALRVEHRRSGVPSALDVRAPVEDWPANVQARLRALQAEAARGGWTWEPYAPRAAEPLLDELPSERGERLVLAGCLLAVLLAVACALVGAVVLVGELYDAIR
jgi:hypothetical protein